MVCYCSEHGFHESTFGRGFDEPSWGAFDLQYDTDGALDFNHLKKVANVSHGACISCF